MKVGWLALGLAANVAVQLVVVVSLRPLELGWWALVIAFPFGFVTMWPFSHRALSASAERSEKPDNAP